MAANPGVLNPAEFGVAFGAGDVVGGKGDGSCAGTDDCDGIGSSGCVSALVGAGAGVGRSTATLADPITPSLSVKWVSGIQVYTGGYVGDHGGPAKSLSTSTATTTPEPDSAPGFETVSAIAGLLLVAAILRRGK